jgi:CheY-like chemotaxis protein
MIGNILVIDDEPAALKLLKDILTAEGHVVRPFNNGNLALRSIRAEAPELVLLDIRMPDMSGFEVCRLIKADSRLREIPVIFISAAADIDDKVRAFEEGGVD